MMGAPLVTALLCQSCTGDGTPFMDRFRSTLGPAMASALLLAMSSPLEGVKAEEDYRITNDVVLTDVRISPVESGDRAQIVFVLENRSAERILFAGITVSGARHSRIVA